MHPHTSEDYKQVRANIQKSLKQVFNIEDSSGFELFGMIQRVAHLSEMLECQQSDDPELSESRWRLLMRLFFEEQMGHTDGLTPTVLSRSHRVSKNTISALLRGLEEQGLIQRYRDPNDMRVYRIQLTEAGRQEILNSAPDRIEGFNRLLSGLSTDERRELTLLLEKLHHSIVIRIHNLDKEETKS